MYIHKSTTVWIFQEGERLSSDRLIDQSTEETTIKYIKDSYL